MEFQNEIELYSMIGSNIKYFRQEAGLTQPQLANQARISLSYLSKIEASGCSKSLSLAVLNQIANSLHVDITDFFQTR